MRRVLLATLAVAGCSKDVEPVKGIEPALDRMPVVVMPRGYKFLGKEYADIRELQLAVDAMPGLKLSLSINEEQGCVAAQRVAEAVELLRAHDPASIAFIGHSSTDACKR